jgi:hypothetical protein
MARVFCVLLKIQSFDESSKQQTWTDGYSEYCGKYFSVDAIEEESSLSSSGKVRVHYTELYIKCAPEFRQSINDNGGC